MQENRQTPFHAARLKICTCQVSRLCARRGCHVLGGPGCLPWVRGVTVCEDCPAVLEQDAAPLGLPIAQEASSSEETQTHATH
jgi:hypothetical protein